MENHYHLFEFVCERIFGAKMLVSTSGLKNSVSSLKEKHTAHTHFDTLFHTFSYLQLLYFVTFVCTFLIFFTVHSCLFVANISS